MTAAFLVLSAWHRLGKLMPPLIGALIVGAVAIAILGTFNPAAGSALGLVQPTLYAPAFSWQAMVELVVPLAITVLVVQNGQGFAVLKAAGHQPPINAITVAWAQGRLWRACAEPFPPA